MMLDRIISGGQTGVDMAGLDAALELGIPTGGTAAWNFTQSVNYNHSISNKELQTKYGLVEGQLTDRVGRNGMPYRDPYSKRTVANCREADGTVWFGNPNSPGGKLTLKSSNHRGKAKPIVNPQSAEELREWIVNNKIRVLNVAGNREFTNRGIYQRAKTMIMEALLIENGSER